MRPQGATKVGVERRTANTWAARIGGSRHHGIEDGWIKEKRKGENRRGEKKERKKDEYSRDSHFTRA